MSHQHHGIIIFGNSGRQIYAQCCDPPLAHCNGKKCGDGTTPCLCTCDRCHASKLLAACPAPQRSKRTPVHYTLAAPDASPVFTPALDKKES